MDDVAIGGPSAASATAESCRLEADPFFHPGWIAFNEEHWNLRAERVTLHPAKGSAWELSVVLYRDRKGRLVTPPRNPHIPVAFRCSASKLSAINRRKRLAFSELARLCAQNGVKGGMSLPPFIDDVRPFLWNGFFAEPRFTYHIELNDFEERADPAVWNKARKAAKLGYTCSVTDDYEAVQFCLQGPECRKGFEHRVNAEELHRLAGMLGKECFACFLAADAEGRPQGAQIRIYAPGGMALAWSAGIRTQALKDGVNSLLTGYSLEYFRARGCTTLDMVGANIPPVAEMKESWGGELKTYYTVRQWTTRNIAAAGYQYAKRRLKQAVWRGGRR